jgi:prevent-host-death family protein
VNLQECLQDARHVGVVITQRGNPIAVVVDVEGLDLEQIELGYSLLNSRPSPRTSARPPGAPIALRRDSPGKLSAFAARMAGSVPSAFFRKRTATGFHG